MNRHRYKLPPLDQLEAFEAAARHLSFTAAADELALTQSAISRQIAAIEAYYQRPLFKRLHRALRLTEDGQALQQTVAQVFTQLQRTSEKLLRKTQVKSVVVTTTSGLAGLWLIPRLTGFAALHPDVDVRISTTDTMLSLERDEVDLAIRYYKRDGVGSEAQALFNEYVVPVCSPKLAGDVSRPLRKPQDLALHTLLKMEDRNDDRLLDWRLWLHAMNLEDLKPASTVHFSQYDQLIQAAVAGQGVALGRLPIVQNEIDNGRLVVTFSKSFASPRGYFLLRSALSAHKPEVRAFAEWLLSEARREKIPDKMV